MQTMMQKFWTSLMILPLVAMMVAANTYSFPAVRPALSGANSKRQSEPITARIPSWIGTVNIEGKAFRVVLDTGSGTLGVKGSGCSACVSSGGNLYDPSASTPTYFDCSAAQCTSHSNAACAGGNRCLISTQYLDGSQWSGLAINETVGMGGLSALGSMVYWANASSSFTNDYSDGILGLGYPPLGYPTSPIRNILIKNGLPDKFWLGFNTDGTGILTLGEANPAYYTGTLQSIAVQPYYGSTYIYYQVTPTSFTVAGTTIATASAFTSQKVIVDSGTTSLALSTTIYNNLMNFLQSSYSGATCYQAFLNGYTCRMANDAAFNTWPTMTVNFANGVAVTMTPRDYIQPYGAPGYYQLGLQDLGSDQQTLLGDPFLTSEYTGFDRVNNLLWTAPSSGNTATSGATRATSSSATPTRTSTSTSTSTSPTSPTQTTTTTTQQTGTQTSTGQTSTVDTGVSSGLTGDSSSTGEVVNGEVRLIATLCLPVILIASLF